MKILFLAALIAVQPASAQSSFNEVRSAIWETPYTKQSLDAHGKLIQFNQLGYPLSEITALSVLKDTVFQRAKQTLKDSTDVYTEPFNKAMHRNGLCYTGTWKISKPNSYGGLFEYGTQVPIIARASVSLSTVSFDGQTKRSFGFVGKIFPTNDLDLKVTTANFFTVNNLNGTLAPSFFTDSFTNQPPFSFGDLMWSPTRVVESILLKALVDAAPDKASAAGIRDLSQVSGAATSRDYSRTPMWMKLSLSENQKPLKNQKDFRAEIDLNRSSVRQAYPEGLVIDIQVAGVDIDPNAKQPAEKVHLGLYRRQVQWQKIGTVTLRESVSSYGCDYLLHFQHPDFEGPLPPNPNP